MTRCLELAKLGINHAAPNPMVGAVLVYQNRIIGEGYHQKYGEPHAEVNCINSVQPEDEHLIAQSTIYVSLEPCAHYGKTPPCADLIIRKQIPKVVVGCRDPFESVNGKGIEKLKAAGIEVEMYAYSQQCIALNKRFFTFHIKKRPFVLLKWAQSADHFIGSNSDKRILISNELSNREVHKLRSEYSAILIGTNTALKDNPSLTNRLWTGKNPIRLVIDKQLSIPNDHQIFNAEAPTVVFNLKKAATIGNVEFVKIEAHTSTIQQILEYCYQKNITSILVEGGQKLLQSFIDESLWDEALVIENSHLYIQNGTHAPLLKGEISQLNQIVLENDTLTYFKSSLNPYLLSDDGK
ncbi:bifunctional diaminohydroxyphosphoribosylaminopyrimidine deaminase/5-amino-6-(5-phosphoribosylamino)uracil reductase RibD [Rhizosphaericola mali]|uniref:Riboflavin biosynthesis protein RibD n=1 Tax=Rhizosphaericola mali TaxID=2545455 RepID=A0A5P2G4N0_9BACT|nr:bifunctional diaminohydroxyphosphoribosylaminopyrimidine deaminase/5-amino-6-(5-phosphoribosylamino)uracil reductase RibD [Rhizosphaericola mali]QES90784.1 bifunctional diaminohydroxyphosphoribosylaminopyrimidine deaminase/5-amino-6-(5-phosphoribosylamino)uracil reductase RibD [Rhizosphaericola mali]